MQQFVAVVVACVLLCGSCSVMVTAWYLHLKYSDRWPLYRAVFVSWLIAGGEYCLQVPANRLAFRDGGLNGAQLRAIAEVFTLVAFLLFSVFVLREPLRLNHVLGFLIVALGVWVVVLGPFNTILVDKRDHHHAFELEEQVELTKNHAEHDHTTR